MSHLAPLVHDLAHDLALALAHLAPHTFMRVRVRVRGCTALRQLQVPQLLDRLAAADPGPEHQADVQTLRDFLK